MDCREILKTYQLYVDDEMDDDQIEVFKQHIENCPECKFRIQIETQFKVTITKKIQYKYKSAPSDLEKRIRNRIF